MYTTLGAPSPPKIRIVATELYQVTLSWEESASHRDVSITGYKVLIDGQPLGSVLGKSMKQTVIDKLKPGMFAYAGEMTNK